MKVSTQTQQRLCSAVQPVLAEPPGGMDMQRTIVDDLRVNSVVSAVHEVRAKSPEVGKIVLGCPLAKEHACASLDDGEGVILEFCA